ncbi:MAG TPA: glycoside hydrolase family 3 N-terminal domain-containing protein [Gaiellaceae bacterium]|nr:glycoside hydrolase family 3 N-terminal domain-containing protein [Gaiellaceae bacterium]
MIVAPLRSAPTSSFLARISAGQIGGVILLGNGWTSQSQLSATITQLQQVACRRGDPLLIGVDQEGGVVRRFPWAPPTVAASEMSSTAIARSQASGAAAALRQVGVGIDFAPVSDTISTPRAFLGSRSFGSDPTLVAARAAAFVQGLQTGGVAATAKHFPGLGSAVANTDQYPVTIDRSRAFLTARLAPFRAAIAAGAQLVMVSNASYPALDPTGVQAVFSHAIVTGLLRDTLGFGGVVVTDSLSATSVADVADQPAKALAAGVDLLLYGTTSASVTGYATLVHDAARSATVRSELAAAIARVKALKAWLAAHGGEATCT